MINIFKIGYSNFFKFPLVFLSSSFLASLQIFQIQYPLATLQEEYRGKKHQNFHFLLYEGNQLSFVIGHLSRDADLVAVEVVGLLATFSVFADVV